MHVYKFITMYLQIYTNKNVFRMETNNIIVLAFAAESQIML